MIGIWTQTFVSLPDSLFHYHVSRVNAGCTFKFSLYLRAKKLMSVRQQGFHHVWEFWIYQLFYGLFVCPWYSYSQIMISEVTPRGKEFLFFSLFSVIGKTSSFIGPLVSSAIIDASPHGNNSTPFYFLSSLSLASFLLLLLFVDIKKSRIEQARFLEDEELLRAKLASGSGSLSS